LRRSLKKADRFDRNGNNVDGKERIFGIGFEVLQADDNNAMTTMQCKQPNDMPDEKDNLPLPNKKIKNLNPQRKTFHYLKLI
jgi:hypothetical protein